MFIAFPPSSSSLTFSLLIDSQWWFKMTKRYNGLFITYKVIMCTCKRNVSGLPWGYLEATLRLPWGYLEATLGAPYWFLWLGPLSCFCYSLSMMFQHLILLLTCYLSLILQIWNIIYGIQFISIRHKRC